jgi:hypothetical protein
MKIFIKDLNIEKELHLYDSDGNDFAEEFILFFWDNGIELLILMSNGCMVYHHIIP